MGNKMTPQTKARIARARARIAAQKSAEDTTTDKDLEQGFEVDAPTTDVDEPAPEPEADAYQEKDSRHARRVARFVKRIAQKKIAEDDEFEDEDEIFEEIFEDATDEVVEKTDEGVPAEELLEETEEVIEAALKRAKRKMRRKADSVSVDTVAPDGDSANIEGLNDGASEIAVDLVDPTENSEEVAQEPLPSATEAEDKVIEAAEEEEEEEEEEDEFGEAEAKVLAAYDLIDQEIAHGYIQATQRKQSLASKYCKEYSTREMKLMSARLAGVGQASKTSGQTRVSRRGSTIPAAKVASNNGTDLSSQCLFG